MTSDKELEMLWKEAMDQEPSTNARKIMILISIIREQREWLKMKDNSLRSAIFESNSLFLITIKDEASSTKEILLSGFQQRQLSREKALAIGYEQTDEMK